MVNIDSVAESSRGSADERSSNETLVARPADPGPLPKKQGEFGWAPPQDDSTQGDAATSTDNLPARHPADRPSTPTPTSAPEPALPPTEVNASSSSLQSQPSVFKRFIRAPRPLPKISGIRTTTILRVSLLVSTLIGSIIGWVITVVHMNAWNAKASAPPPIPDQPPTPGPGNSTIPAIPVPSQQQFNQMTSSSLAFVHVAFGAAVLFQLLMLERAVYRLRAERYAFLHPDEMAAAAMTAAGGSVMGLAPWNRPPLPTYAAALGIRGTGFQDNIIAAPPPPEYGNTRGSVLLLSAHLTRTTSTSSRPASQHTVRDALGRPMHAWSRPVSYSEDELRQNARQSLDLEVALSRLEGSGMGQVASEPVTRPENAVVRA